jgi:hypothetical protein
MASEPVHYTRSPVASHEKDVLERDEKLEDAEGTNTPSSDGMTAKERAALTRRLLLKLDIRYLSTDQLT